MEECRGAYRGLVVRPEGRRPFRRARRGWILKKSAAGIVLGWSGSEFGEVAGCCAQGNGLSCSIKCAKILGSLRSC